MVTKIGTNEILTLFNSKDIENAEIGIKISGASTLNNPKDNTVLFLKKYLEEYLGIIEKVKGCCIFLHTDYKGKTKTQSNVLIFGDNPRLDFARFLQTFFTPKTSPSIAQTACIGRNISLGNDVRIGEYCVIGDDVVIGDRTEIRHHVILNARTIIGNDCLIKSNAVIGEEGFGFEKDENGIPIRIPHMGRVVIGKGVEIGAGSVIARGTIDNTWIDDNVKIDDQVFIAHNVRVGANCYIIACSEISGSARIGNGCWLGPNCSIMNGISIGERCIVGLGTVVIKSIPGNVVVAGSPARILRENAESDKKYET